MCAVLLAAAFLAPTLAHTARAAPTYAGTAAPFVGNEAPYTSQAA